MTDPNAQPIPPGARRAAEKIDAQLLKWYGRSLLLDAHRDAIAAIIAQETGVAEKDAALEELLKPRKHPLCQSQISYFTDLARRALGAEKGA